MAKDLNNTSLTGRLGQDPRTKYLQGGTCCCEFSLAVSTSKKDGDKWVDEATWVPIVAYGKVAEIIAQHCGKGDRVAVAGHLRLDQWVDKNNGEKRQLMKVVVDDVVFLVKAGTRTVPKASTAPVPKDPSPADAPYPPFTDDDLPF